jgi:hypothetical protein
MAPVRILLQTTIETIEDDWHIGRFGLLQQSLEAAGFEVVARDRAVPGGQPDPVLSTLDGSDFDQLWLFAVDTGDGICAEECGAIARFRARGGGLMVTRDHMDLGSSVCSLGGVGDAHHFHSHNPSRDPARQAIDDPYTTYISWPNYHSGANGDFQEITVEGERHPVLTGVDLIPAHPHEGEVDAPADQSARVVASSRSKVTGRPFNIAVAFEAEDGKGRGWAESTFHHFSDCNWDPNAGFPTFVDEPPGYGMLTHPEARTQTERYVRNLALWLAGKPV